jgi:hypothetical protein
MVHKNKFLFACIKNIVLLCSGLLIVNYLLKQNFMDKHLLEKWTISLLLIVALCSSCINKDYDFNNLDDGMVIPGMKLGFPLGTIRYTALQIADKAKLNHDVVVEGDTIFLRYYTELDFLVNPGSDNVGYQDINVFQDVKPDGSILYFSNPVFNCKVKNSGNTPITFDIKLVLGMKEGYDSIPIDKSYTIVVPENQTIMQRFDRVTGETHRIFQIGDPETGVGPDIMKYYFSHNAQSNNDIFADMTVKLPLSFDRGSKMIFRDTLSLNLESYKDEAQDYDDYIEKVIVSLDYINKMPVDGITEFIFLDKNNVPVTGLHPRVSKLDRASLKPVPMQGGDMTNITQKETNGTMYIKFEKSEWEIAKNITSMLVKTTLANPDKNIHIRPDDFLQFKVKLYVEGNIKL